MSGTLSGNPQISAAQWQARMTGQPAAVTVNGQTLLVSPDGSVRTSVSGTGGTQGYAGVQGLAGSPSGPAASPTNSLLTNRPVGANTGLFTPTTGAVGSTLTAPRWTLPAAVPTVDDYGRVIASPQQRQQGTLNQANPQTTYVSTATPQPATSVPVVGSTGTQGGPSVAPTYNMPPAPTVAQQASTYRAAHGLSDGSETDRLNAESLAAAQAGRTNLNRDLAAQYGQPLAAGTYGPRTDVVNALTMPTTAPTSMLATRQPIVLAPTYTQAYTPANAQQQSNSLLNQGLY